MGLETITEILIGSRNIITDKKNTKKSLPPKIERIIVVVAQRWGREYPGSTVGLIGDDAIEICKEYGIDYENYS